MAEQNIKSSSQISSAPPADIEIRTMESDIKSIKQGGGDLSAMETVKRTFPEETGDKGEISLGIAGYTGPEKAIFETQARVSGETKLNPALKIIIITVIIIAIAFGIGYSAYSLALKLL